ncbi:hypothetical protein [Chryseobacterium sp.]|jgi:hypothetical protein|uniref:hypothetical protein n=1 Tax=Chryseobacterium sp. TaxID=1871047 RepID=UPI00261DFE0F|nr:hypothetical protein [Chryseobacterium sp.]
METNKMINQLNYLFELLDFETISSLSNENYKILILDFFIKVKKLKYEGLNLNEDLKSFINNKHIQYYDYYEKNHIYEERMQMILSELMGFCSPPKFWNVSFEEYMKLKWGIDIN